MAGAGWRPYDSVDWVLGSACLCRGWVQGPAVLRDVSLGHERVWQAPRRASNAAQVRPRTPCNSEFLKTYFSYGLAP